ncbi:phosphoribosyl-ATP pyrophosphatase [Malonomonas rubra DSM 5091]|uniref:Phosphoribosyl-ATP pyrophosphatase n=1 Tax=Malonomonas rubra DSM 5091 TaxID=1122189 RepID=A0A1M6FA75_MALRU|nr:phosphoribosyl-ATP diphosphatase [Malonomonas rubra]SHI94567.1 phosphoribosyl-ATP pyrophosphatase [Malonomonas rubra DSM 5091]
MAEQVNPREDILEAVYQIVLERKAMADGEKSYVKSLFDRGLDKILSKVGEEATETAVAGKGGDKDELVYEVADLFFHVLVLLGYYDIPPEKIYAELRRRFGMSGIEEKANRSK